MEENFNIEAFFNSKFFTKGQLKSAWEKSIENKTVEERDVLKNVFKDNLSKFYNKSNIFYLKPANVNKTIQHDKYNVIIKNFRNLKIKEVLNEININEDQFVGIASKHKILDYKLEEKFNDNHLVLLNDFFLTRLTALERKKDLARPKPINLKNNKKAVKKNKRTSQNRKATVYDKIYENSGIGKLIYIGKKS